MEKLAEGNQNGKLKADVKAGDTRNEMCCVEDTLMTSSSSMASTRGWPFIACSICWYGLMSLRYYLVFSNFNMHDVSYIP